MPDYVKIDYKRELEEVAKNMIFVHSPDILIKIIIRRLIKVLDLEHAGVLLQDKISNSYLLSISRGKGSFCLPSGFLSLNKKSPIIRFFTSKQISGMQKKVLLLKDVQRILSSSAVRKNPEMREFLCQLREQMVLYRAKLCIPSFFRNQLIGVFVLGKKKRGGGFSEEEINFLRALASDVSMSFTNARLFEELLQQVEFNRHLFYNTISALAQAIEAKDIYTSGHTQRVTEISLRIGQRLIRDSKRNFNSQFLENVKVSSMLHDIGKIGIPEEILNKKGKLTIGERKIIQRHPVIGADILGPIKELGSIRSAILSHHERFDGKGYPHGLKRDRIPIVASVIGCADAFDAMTSDRPYRDRMSETEVFREFKSERGKQFHPAIADIVMDLIKKGQT